MESVKVKSVIPRLNQILLIEFDNEIRKTYNVSSLFEQFPESQILRNKPMFDIEHVDCGGYSVSWTPDIDISEWELWDNGTTV